MAPDVSHRRELTGGATDEVRGWAHRQWGSAGLEQKRCVPHMESDTLKRVRQNKGSPGTM